MERQGAPDAVAAELRRLKSRQWTRVEAERVLDLWRASGRPLQTFAREHGLVPQRLRRWRDVLAASTRSLAAPVKLVPAVIVPRPAPAAVVAGTSPVVIVQATPDCAVEVVAPSRVAPAWVAALVVALETAR